MRFIVVIAFLFSSAQLYSQLWKDSLEAARKAYKDEKYIDALKYYRSAQNNAPENIDFSDEIGQTAYKARQFEVAEKIYRQNADKKQTGKHQANSWHNVGNSLMKKQDYSGAVEAYKESLRLNPTDEETRYNLSEAIRKLKQSKQENNKGQDQNKDKSGEQDQNKGQKGDQGKQQDGGDQQGNKKGNNKSPQNSGSDNSNSQGQLADQTVEKLLDKLMKEEAETKRQVAPGGNKSNRNKSGKDW